MLLLLIILSGFLIFLIAFLSGATDIHFHSSYSKSKIRIACVGDSITNGALIPGCFFRSYPSRLQKLLGAAYQVENYGLNDRTLQPFGNKPYTREKEYRRSLDFAPDIVIILLGTNDTKTINWHSEEHFLTEYRRFLENYTELKTAPKIILCTPPWAVNAENRLQALTNDAAAERLPLISKSVRQIGTEYGLPIADLYTAFTGKRELLSYDGLHPNARGAAAIAEAVVTVISARMLF